MTGHQTGTREQHHAARLELLEAEKELTRRSDELARRRRALPWVAVEKHCLFDTDNSEKTLRDLFAGRSQLLVYHFMFGPEWSEGCHTYSCYARGLEAFNGAYQLLDRAPNGRDEDELPVKPAWIRRHDQYEPGLAEASR